MDTVKSRLTSSTTALREVSTWEERIAKLESTFARGDLLSIAMELQELRSSLDALQSLPQIRDAKEKDLSDLRDRLDLLATPQLLEALDADDLEAFKELVRFVFIFSLSYHQAP